MRPINIGIVGAGTVGGGTIEVLSKNAKQIQQKIGCPINILMAASMDVAAARKVCPETTIVTDDAFAVVNNPDVAIVVELIGGTTIAKDLVLQAIANGKSVVTANKKLLAEYGNEIFKRAEDNKVTVKFEAAVAGGIPIIKVLREGLVANNINWIAGIINGTSNFILSEMRDKNTDFPEALKQAQELGYAEADPTFDIEGHDAGHKISLLSALAFGTPIDFSHCYLEGISKLQGKDITYAEELGYRVKLLAISRKTDKGIELRVHPTLISQDRLLASVNGVMNAVYVHSDMLGKSLYYGAGAGSLPTASAVVADIVDLARELINQVTSPVPHLTFLPSEVKAIPLVAMDEIKSSYYLRMLVKDEAGVLSKLTHLFAKHDVSIEAMIQKADFVDELAEIIILTHSTIEKNIKAVIRDVESLSLVENNIVMIRVETFYS